MGSLLNIADVHDSTRYRRTRARTDLFNRVGLFLPLDMMGRTANFNPLLYIRLTARHCDMRFSVRLSTAA